MSKISKKTLLSLIDAHTPKDCILNYEVGDKKLDIVVHTTIPLEKMKRASEEIAELQFINDEFGNTIYVPAFETFAYRYVLMHYFTDLNLDAITPDANKEPDSKMLTPLWNLVMSDIFNHIYDKIDMSCACDIFNASQILVETKRKEIEPGPQQVWGKINLLLDEIKRSFGELSAEDVDQTKAVIEKLSGMTEEKIVELMR